MNQRIIISEIEKMPDASSLEKKLMREKQFVTGLSRVVYKICQNNIEMSSNQIGILLSSLLRRYRKMVKIEAKEIKSNGKLFLQLLKQKMRDNFKTLDRNLNKFQLRTDLRKKTSKINKMSVKRDLKKFSSH